MVLHIGGGSSDGNKLCNYHCSPDMKQKHGGEDKALPSERNVCVCVLVCVFVCVGQRRGTHTKEIDCGDCGTTVSFVKQNDLPLPPNFS